MSRFRDYLQLVRLPAVFTAMSDVMLGFLLTNRSFEHLVPVPGEGGELIGDDGRAFGLLLLSSSCLYLSGMAFNDIFDLNLDRRERPERPLPSGRISPWSAILLAVLLMSGGVTAAALVSREALLIAAILAGCILLYNALLKKTPLGPLGMAGCRFLNVMLGAGTLDSLFLWGRPQVPVATGLAIYIAGLTWFAREEAAERPRRIPLVMATLIVNLAFIYWGQLVISHPWRAEGTVFPGLVMLAVIAVTLDRRLFRAASDPSPNLIRGAVRLMILSIITLDATMIYVQTGEPLYALITLALLIPAVFLGRWIFVT